MIEDMSGTGYAAMIENASDVDGDNGEPAPRCPSCGSALLLATRPTVRWVCPDCARWGWVEPPHALLTWPDLDLWRLERAKDAALRAYRTSPAVDTTEGPEWDAFVDAVVALGIETVHRDAIREGAA